MGKVITIGEVLIDFIPTSKGRKLREVDIDSLEELTRKLHDYVYWFNPIRIHGTLCYLSPIEYKLKHLKKLSSFVLTIQTLLQPIIKFLLQSAVYTR
jgi:hypothetical protein